ncbi:MAG: cytochrome P450 [Verrucomicrobiota bacterium]
MSIPRYPAFDQSLALLRDGYCFGLRRFEELQTDAFHTRLLLRKATFVRGREAAEVFYEPDRFTRRDAMPPTTLRLLQDKGSVQTLDGEAHRRRKELFLSLMRPGCFDTLGEIFEATWERQQKRWEEASEVVLHPAFQELLCRTACLWSGIPLPEEAVARRTGELDAMIHGAGSIGPRNWRGLLLRQRTERWGRALIEAVRAEALQPPDGSPLAVLASHRDAGGDLLSPKIAAVELLNILRPIVAVARYLTFVALARHEHARAKAWLEEDANDPRLTAFAQEVRRLYPFFPLIAGRVREPFEWRGEWFAEDAWMILDLYGTHHDAGLWEEPEAFRPERFAHGEADPFALIAQGGGEHARTHRCPGEWITLDLMKRAARRLSHEMRYEVPAQDLTVDLGKMPALPRSGFRVTAVGPGP